MGEPGHINHGCDMQSQNGSLKSSTSSESQKKVKDFFRKARSQGLCFSLSVYTDANTENKHKNENFSATIAGQSFSCFS